MAEISRGKDTIIGHWEIAGCPVFNPFPVYPDGFPPGVIEAFTNYTEHTMLGNKVSSGAVIIDELGSEQMYTDKPIIYTSADSVFHIVMKINSF
jgi:phosphopentomutase